MNDRWIRFLTIAPLFLFGWGRLVTQVVGWNVLEALIAAAVALPLVAVARPRALGPALAPSLVLFVLLGLTIGLGIGTSSATLTGPGADLALGVLLGLPLWFLGVAVGSPDRPGLALLALGAGLLELVTLAVTLQSLGATPVGPNAFLAAWFLTEGHQIGALGAALMGLGLRSRLLFPLAGYTDATFVALAVLAMAGLLVPLLRPEEGARETIPTPDRRDLATPRRTIPPPVLFAQAEAATPPRPAPGAGFVPVVGAVGAVVGFLAIALAVPAYTFLALTVYAAASLLLLVVLARRRPAVPARPSARPAVRPGATARPPTGE
jgi:hypothetical protein